MKKVLNIIIIGIICLAITGCGTKEEEIVTICHMTNNNLTAEYNFKSEYKIYSLNGIVNKVETTETVYSNSSTILNYFENYLTKTYDNYNETYGGYYHKIIKEDDELVSKTSVDYKVMNLEKYIEDNITLEEYINDKKEITLEGIKSIYTSLGATCE